MEFIAENYTTSPTTSPSDTQNSEENNISNTEIQEAQNLPQPAIEPLNVEGKPP